MTPSPSATPAPTGGGAWGAYPSRQEACAAVANDVLALALLPVSLSGSPTVENVQSVEQEVEGMLRDAPDGLVAELSRVQLLIDSYGEELAADPDAQFDGQALDASLVPVRDWLDETCRDSG